jgi:hypothetical protein
VTETWWWCFYIPERNINGEVYFWKHSNRNHVGRSVGVPGDKVASSAMRTF